VGNPSRLSPDQGGNPGHSATTGLALRFVRMAPTTAVSGSAAYGNGTGEFDEEGFFSMRQRPPAYKRLPIKDGRAQKSVSVAVPTVNVLSELRPFKGMGTGGVASSITLVRRATLMGRFPGRYGSRQRTWSSQPSHLHSLKRRSKRYARFQLAR